MLSTVSEETFGAACGPNVHHTCNAAGYFSYKWAEVLSADAFSAFEEAGLEDDEAVQTTGRRFRDTVLSLGGSMAPSDVFKVGFASSLLSLWEQAPSERTAAALLWLSQHLTA